MLDPVRQLEVLRGNRQWSGRDQSIDPILQRLADDAERTRKRLGQLIELWQALVPQELAQKSAVVRYNRGVVEVVADSASVRYELDRAMRDGLEQDIRRSFNGTLRSIRIRVGATP